MATSRIIDNVYIVTISGALDREGAAAAQGEVLTAIPAGADVLLDLSAVSYLSSPGLRMLLAISRHVAEGMGRLIVADVPGRCKAVMDLCGVSPHLVMAQTVDEGVRQFKTSARIAA